MAAQHSILDDILNDTPQDVDVFVSMVEDLAEHVKQVMDSQGLNRTALAKRLNKSESEVTKWLSGMHNLTLQSVAKLAVALQTDMLVTPQRPQGYFGREENAIVVPSVSTTSPKVEHVVPDSFVKDAPKRQLDKPSVMPTSLIIQEIQAVLAKKSYSTVVKTYSTGAHLTGDYGYAMAA